MFDRYAAATAPSWGRRALAIASIALHVAAAIALAIYSIMHIEEIAPPAVSLTFFSAPPPPPPPPAGHHKKQQTKPKPTVVIPTHAMTIVQPKVEEKPPEKEEKEEPDEPDGVEGGVKGGVKGGVVGGVVGSTGTGGGSPKSVAYFTLNASRLSNPDPHLPDFFKAAHGHSTINASFRICLRQDGHVESVESKMSVAGNVDQMVMDQIKATWLYKPQQLPVCFVQPFKFNIN
jgi:protein TonB